MSPWVGGMIIAYRLEPLTDPSRELGKVKKDMTPEEKAAEEADRRENLRLRQVDVPPVSCQSAGRALVQPLVTLQNREEEYVVWPTDRGIVSFGRIDRRDPTALIVKHELKTDADIVSRPAYLPPDPHVHGDMGVIYVTLRDGRVYAILEKSGEMLVEFPAAEPVLESPAVINDRVYVCTQLGGMFCLDAKTGKQYRRRRRSCTSSPPANSGCMPPISRGGPVCRPPRPAPAWTSCLPRCRPSS